MNDPCTHKHWKLAVPREPVIMAPAVLKPKPEWLYVICTDCGHRFFARERMTMVVDWEHAEAPIG